VKVDEDALRPRTQRRRFYDGGDDTEPPDRSAPERIVLEQDLSARVEVFAMRRRVGYDDEEVGPLLVPADLERFRTDLASVPSVFTWLVPRTGHHLPPALVHDALVIDTEPQTHIGASVDRVAADRVFRRAMRDRGVGVVRRWLVWSAVTLATIWGGSGAWSRAEHLRRRVVMVGTHGLIAVLGVLSTLDLVDVVGWVPWMGQRVWWLELAGGFAAAVVVPLVLGALWGRFWPAGTITGVALGVLLHVTVVIAAITLAYQVVEWVARRRPLLLILTGGVVVLACLVMTVLMVGVI